jgi:hypothetical protein
MPTFSGKERNWDSFIYKFDRIADRQEWRDSRKLSCLIDCLSDRALEYAVKLKLSEYRELKRSLAHRFDIKDTPPVARRVLALCLRKMTTTQSGN